MNTHRLCDSLRALFLPIAIILRFAVPRLFAVAIELLVDVLTTGRLSNLDEDTHVEKKHDGERDDETDEDWQNLGDRVHVMPGEARGRVVEPQDEVGNRREGEPEKNRSHPHADVHVQRLALATTSEMPDGVVRCAMSIEADDNNDQIGHKLNTAEDTIEDPTPVVTRERKAAEVCVHGCDDQDEPKEKVRNGEVDDEVVVVATEPFLDGERGQAEAVGGDDRSHQQQG